MKALVLHAPNAPFELEERPIPKPKPDELLVRVRACGVGLTVHHAKVGNAPSNLPVIPGHEIAGEVVEVGSAVEGFSVGDRVTPHFYLFCGRCRYCLTQREPLCENTGGYIGRQCDGGYAEYVALPARNFVKIPPDLPYDERPAEVAVICDAIATPYKVNRRAQIKPLEDVLVIGAGGGVGIHMVQLARLAGGRVLAADRGDAKLAAPRPLAHARFPRWAMGYLLVLPAVIYVLALIGFPLVLGLWYSLTDVTVAREGQFIGLRNFVEATRDASFRLAVRNTLIIGVVATAAKITLSVALAFLMLGAFPGRRVLRTLFVLPWTVPIALSTIDWKWMFHSQYSVVNWLLLKGGIIDQPIQWLGTPIAAMAAVIIVSTWRAVPFGAITVLAGLTAVPAEVIEAARIDGAGWWARFQRVIVPIIAPILFIAVLFDLIFTLSELVVVYLLTGGGPVDQTQVLATYSLQVGVNGSQLGLGAAIALFLLPVQLVLTAIALRAIARREGL